MNTTPDQRREPIRKLLESTANRFINTHREAIQAVAAVLPEAAAEVYGYHHRYIEHLDNMLVATRVSPKGESEPLWHLLMLLQTRPSDTGDFAGDITIYNKVQQRFGLPADED
jgi:hypothetical protein